MTPSLYIHIPFCKRRCIYCNFYSDIYDANAASPYIDILAKQIDRISIRPSTIYVGGGTPTALDRKLLERLLRSLKRIHSDNAEFTFEANPESLDNEKLKLLSDHGVNRISIGAQSFEERKLKKIGRIHTAARSVESVAAANKAGFKNIGIDLIFGVWDEDQSSWKKELEKASRLPITHVSCYELTYEKGTPLFDALLAGSVQALEEEAGLIMFETAIDTLSVGGLKQYEISNFARPGFECRHNINYWENGPYIGLGASAVSYLDGTRSKNVSDTAEYIRRFDEGKALAESSEKLPPERRARETAALKIRTRAGIDFEWFKNQTGYDFRELERKALPRLLEDGLIKYKKDNKNDPTGICLKRKGILLCDTVSSALL